MKRLLAILLILTMLPIPAAYAREKESKSLDYAAVDAMWQVLEQAEEEALAKNEYRGKTLLIDESTAAAVAKEVQEQALYKEGSLCWNGNGRFTFETTVGVTCGYSVRLRNMARERQTLLENVALTDTVYNTEETTAAAGDVYVFEPYYGLDSSFTKQYQQEGKNIALTTGGSCRLFTQKDATVDAIADAVEQGTVVIFDSHGDTDYYSYDRDTDTEDCTSGATTSYILLQTGEGLTEEDYADDNGTYHAVYYGKDLWDSRIYYYAVDGTCIANHMDRPAQDNLLWMATCLGMATDGLHGPLMEKGAAVAYGYSQSVTFAGDYCWEECFWDEMCKGARVKDAIAEMKRTYGAWDYSEEIYAAYGWRKDSDLCETIEKAQRDRRAFPIVVSEEDIYPGHGKVDDLQEVNSTWKLLTDEPVNVHTVTASSNNENLGQVTVDGNTVTALPMDHALLEGYTLSPENAATVEREDTVFTLTDITADCHLTVIFAEKPKVTVYYIVPEGCTKENSEDYEGKTIALTSPEGKPVADGEAYSFLGWSVRRVADSPEKPEYFTESFVPTETETTLYALYTYEDRTGTYYTTELRMKVCYAANYADVDLEAWYHEALDFVLEEAYMNGTGKDAFEPNGTLTRAMLATILYRMSEIAGEYSHPFTDVAEDQWYSDAIAWAYETGVVNGTSKTTFDPNGFVTREQTAAMLYRYAKMAGQSLEATGNLATFKDADEASDYARLPLRWAVGEGIINGKGNNILDPTGTATRAEIAKMIYHWIG